MVFTDMGGLCAFVRGVVFDDDVPVSGSVF